MKKVLFAAFEGLPFIKTGGLADVVYALPKALDKDKYEVKIVLPLLKMVKDKYQDRLEYVDYFEVHSGYINEGMNYIFGPNSKIHFINRIHLQSIRTAKANTILTNINNINRHSTSSFLTKLLHNKMCIQHHSSTSSLFFHNAPTFRA